MANRQRTHGGLSMLPDELKQRPVQPEPVKGKDLIKKEFDKRLANAGLHQLIYTPFEQNDCMVNVSTLQRMNLLIIQKKLVEIAATIERSETVSENEQKEMRVALSDYATALRDWNLSLEASKAANGDMEEDPFLITSRNSLQRSLLTEAKLISDDEVNTIRKAWDWKKNYPVLPGVARKAHNAEQRMNEFWDRLIAAIFGGIALIGPMLLMVLHKDLLTALLTTSISVVLVAVIAAWKLSEQSPSDVLGIVSAYAAVLVVFLGVSQ